jgi:hypothetical protein
MTFDQRIEGDGLDRSAPTPRYDAPAINGNDLPMMDTVAGFDVGGGVHRSCFLLLEALRPHLPVMLVLSALMGEMRSPPPAGFCISGCCVWFRRTLSVQKLAIGDASQPAWRRCVEFADPAHDWIQVPPLKVPIGLPRSETEHTPDIFGPENWPVVRGNVAHCLSLQLVSGDNICLRDCYVSGIYREQSLRMKRTPGKSGFFPVYNGDEIPAMCRKAPTVPNGTVAKRMRDHVAVMSHGANGSFWEPLKHNGNLLQHRRHEKARSQTGLSQLSAVPTGV